MIKLSQNNKEWAKETIGNTKVTIGAMGCTITCISMISDYFKSFKTPDWMAKNLSFTPEARIYWNSINNNKELNFDFEYRYYIDKHGNTMYNAIQEAVSNPDKAVILEVRRAHWVVDLSKYLWLNKYKTQDPWPTPNGVTKYYPKSYITGCAVFKRR